MGVNKKNINFSVKYIYYCVFRARIISFVVTEDLTRAVHGAVTN